MSLPVSPLAPESFPSLADIEGVTLHTGRGTDHYPGRPNLLLASFAEGTSVAGTFTSSKCPSATVDWCRVKLANSSTARALVVNAGNANAFTGSLGIATVEQVAQKAADLIGASPDDIYQASTGVIAEPLDPDVICQALENIKPATFADAAQAICTTDTFKKGARATVTFDGVAINFVGIAKGSGMIEPDMATMLSFIFTDAPIAAPLLQSLLAKAVSKSFNAITVDGDTSTSDTVLIFATGKADIAAFEREDDPRVDLIQQALSQLCLDLAHQVVRDGEGASKFVTIKVTGAQDDASAHKIAQTIANSPLVKTAIAGEDANWGRVVMAVGRAGEPASRDALSISFGPHLLARDGQRVDNYSEEAVSAYMTGEAIDIHVDVGISDGNFTMWTCDLTHGYISINADYRS